MDPTQIAAYLAQNFAPPQDLMNLAMGQPGGGAMAGAAPIPGGTADPWAQQKAPGVDWMKMLTGMGGAGQLGAALKPGDFRSPAPYMGGFGGKPAVQSQVEMAKHPQPNIQALLAYLGQGQR